MSLLEHPETPRVRPMTDKQAELLARIVATNGGGVSASSCSRPVLQALVRRHFVQGKSGQEYRVVHTARGLDALRKYREGRP